MSETTTSPIPLPSLVLPDVVRFTKVTAGGNDFVCLDNTDESFSALLTSPGVSEFVRRLCGRGTSVGADGIIFACRAGCGAGADIVARFLEPDGSEAELCGNGTACFTYWIVSKGLVPGPDVRILTAAGTVRGTIHAGNRQRVRICIPDPYGLELDLKLEVNGRDWQAHFLNTGIPHAVTFVTTFEHLDVNCWGAAIRHHPHFQPRGANANFVKVLNVGHIAVRTFEFGVEAETLACGTGSAASAILACLYHDWPVDFRDGRQPVLVDVLGGETLRVWFVANDRGHVSRVCLEIGTRAIYEGELRPELLAELRAACTPSYGQ